MDDDRLLPTQRIGLAVWRLAAGAVLSPAELAAGLGMSRPAAWSMLTKLSRVLPLCQDDDGRWQVFDPLSGLH